MVSMGCEDRNRMVSIIIPVLNEEKYIRRIQRNLERLDGEYEVIFSDGGSTDRTREFIKPPFRLISGARGRGRQMNMAADAARGDILFFIHCDVLLKRDVLLRIPENVRTGKAAGYLKIIFDSRRILMRICGFMSGVRARLRKIAFSDQGLMIQKDLFEKMGKMPDIPLMEDYEFSVRLRKKKIPLVRIDSPILVSSRRFKKCGMLRTMWQMQKFQFQYRMGMSAKEIAKKYGDIR